MLPASQRERIINALDTSYNLTSFNPAIHDLSNQLALTKLTNVENQTDIVDSSNYNKTVAGILADLHILYNQAELIELFVENSNLLHMSDIETLRKEVAHLKAREASLKNYVASSASMIVKTENFASKSGLETARHFFTDRDGDIVPDSHIVDIDVSQEVCKLPHTRSIDGTKNKNGHLTAQIKLLSRTGFSDNASLDISYALDSTTSTFWGEAILTDAPIKNPTHEITEGAVVEFEVILDKPKIVNEISMKPFGSQPLDIMNIRYQTDINTESPLLPLIPEQLPKSILNETVVAFQPTTIRRLVITVRQKNYSIVSYLTTEEALNNEQIWETVRDLHETHALGTQGTWRNLEPNITNPSFIQEKLDEISGWKQHLDDYQNALQNSVSSDGNNSSILWTTEAKTDESRLYYMDSRDYPYARDHSYMEGDSNLVDTNYLRSIDFTLMHLTRDIRLNMLLRDRYTMSGRLQTVNTILNIPGYQKDMPVTISGSWAYDATFRWRITIRRPTVLQPMPTTPTPRIQVNKYEYLFGLYEIGIKELTYNNTGIFVSKPYFIKGNTIETELSVNERKMLIDINNEATRNELSIEYYVTHTNLPSQNQWIPILPREQQRIFGEYLQAQQGNNHAIRNLRFRASFTGHIIVYGNGKPLLQHEWVILPDYQNIQILNYNSHLAYTVDYDPDSMFQSPWKINFPQQGLQPTTVIDTFENGTDRNGTITLSQYPYVDYQRLRTDHQYVPIKVTLYDATIAGPGTQVFNIVGPLTTHASTKNITDYHSTSQPKLTPYNLESPHLVFEYLHHKHKIYFTETFNRSEALINQAINHGNAKIKVEYQVLASSVRLKAILRNTSGQVYSTPILDDYSIKFFLQT